jgi:hypothetical protein
LFRYNATHRAAELWGPQVAQLIRDAPIVEFRKITPPLEGALPARESGELEQRLGGPELINITNAAGLVHLRNALVEDRSFDWSPAAAKPNDRWQWVLTFRDDSSRSGATLIFSPDADRVVSLERADRVVSSEPIAKGLREMFAEFLALPAETSAADSPSK